MSIIDDILAAQFGIPERLEAISEDQDEENTDDDN